MGNKLGDDIYQGRVIIIATIYAFDAPIDESFVHFFEKDMAPTLRGAGATLLGYFVTEQSENTFPALPVRAGENVFVWFASFAEDAALAAYRHVVANNPLWSASLVPTLHQWLSKPEEVLELLPTRRSLVR